MFLDLNVVYNYYLFCSKNVKNTRTEQLDGLKLHTNSSFKITRSFKSKNYAQFQVHLFIS